jgi:glycosyltransferase involved in cell wall biosynthesis
VAGSYHTELQAYARMRSADPQVEYMMRSVLAKFYAQCKVVLSPSGAADESLLNLGIPADRLARWDRGVDLDRFNPARYAPGVLPNTHSELGTRFNVLYVGRLSKEKGIDLLAESFLIARDHDPRLHLVLAGRGPEEETLRRRLGSAVTFLGWVEGDRLAQVYASADLFMFASTTDTFGQVILEAQASGLPVLAVDAGGPAELTNGQPADAAVLRRHQRGAVSCRQQQSAGRKSGQLEQRKPHRIERGEPLQPNGAADAENDAADDEHDLHPAGRMAPQDAFGDD